jgi:hypothetical protein
MAPHTSGPAVGVQKGSSSLSHHAFVNLATFGTGTADVLLTLAAASRVRLCPKKQTPPQPVRVCRAPSTAPAANGGGRLSLTQAVVWQAEQGPEGRITAQRSRQVAAQRRDPGVITQPRLADQHMWYAQPGDRVGSTRATLRMGAGAGCQGGSTSQAAGRG